MSDDCGRGSSSDKEVRDCAAEPGKLGKIFRYLALAREQRLTFTRAIHRNMTPLGVDHPDHRNASFKIFRNLLESFSRAVTR